MTESPDPKWQAAVIVGGVGMAVGFLVFTLLWSVDALLETIRERW